MSREDASKLFKDGIEAILKTKSNPNSSNGENLLIQARQRLEHAAELIEENDPCYNVYSQAYASASARCILQADCSPEIDRTMSSSPLFEGLSNEHQRTIDLDMHAAALDALWDGIDNARDRFSISHTELFSNRLLASHIFSFSRAIACSSENIYLQCLWYTFRATTLYLRVDRYNPDEIALCIVSIKEILRLRSIVNLSPPNNMDSTLLQVLPDLQQDLLPFKRRLSWLESLASAYIHRHIAGFREYLDLYNSTSDPNHLDSAIAEAREALSWGRDTGLLPELRFKLLLALGRALHERYLLKQPLEDLEDSAEYLREALAYQPAPADRLLFCKQLLSTVTADLAKELSDDPEPDVWLKSLVLWRESVGLTGLEVPDLLAERLYELANTAFKLYDRSDEGTSAHVSEAVVCLARAASIATSPRFCSQVLFAQSGMLYKRFIQENNREDFNESLYSSNEAWQIICQVPELAQLDLQWSGLYRHGAIMLRKVQENSLTNLGKNTEDIQQIIKLFESIIPFPHANRLNALNHLGRAHTMLYLSRVQAGQAPIQCISSLEEAVKYHQMALEGTPQDEFTIIHPRYTFLGAVNHEISRIPELDDRSRARYLETAIDYLRKANHTQSLSSFKNLAAALEDRYKILGNSQDLHECISLLQTQNTPHGPLVGHPRQFFQAATQLVQICRDHNIKSQLLPAYRLLFKALRRISHMGLTSVARHQALVENSAGHACDAAAAALTINDPKAAIELLEDGRSLFFSQLVPMQTDTKRIRDVDPKLASDLESALEKVQQYSVETDRNGYEASRYHSEGGFAEEIDTDAMDVSPQSRELRHFAHWLETYVNEIRELPGHADFMKPKPFSRLKDAAQHCPAVYINVSQYRCDAIILGNPNYSSQITVVPLPISSSKMYDLSRTMQTTVKLQGREVRDNDLESVRHFVRSHSTKQSPATIIKNVLKQLWEYVVHPILKVMGCLNGLHLNPEKLQRVCWCPDGPAATSLPFHAAGNYDLDSEHWATTHIVSSYTPTLSSLLHAYERNSNLKPQATRMLLVSLPATPPSNPLSCVREERDGIIRTIGASKGHNQVEVTVLHDSAGRVADIKSMLPTHQLLHLACHGKQDKDDPLESAILLHDGNLTLRDIIRMPLPSAELVYLSACQTATGDIDSPDESLSLAGGFLFSGYRSAVATMWSINDRDGADVATAFYKHLVRQNGPLALGAALALHCAIQDLRKANPNIDLVRWIPFMCLGATGGTR